jgi:hypothetical protein
LPFIISKPFIGPGEMRAPLRFVPNAPGDNAPGDLLQVNRNCTGSV